MTGTYDIATETGGKFCECTKQGEEVMLIGKEGPLSLTKLIAQASNPALAHQMRSKRSRNREKTVTGKQ